jgi:CheY-like chemotaxis protein
MAFTLRRCGLDVLEASEGEAALRLIRENRPDLAVLDVRMPGLTGIEIVRALTAQPDTAAIPVVLVSAWGQVHEIDDGLASGARAYIVKPFQPQALAERVLQLLAVPARPEPIGRGP